MRRKVNVTFLAFYKQSDTVCFVYLECNLEQDSYGWFISKKKYKKMLRNTYRRCF